MPERQSETTVASGVIYEATRLIRVGASSLVEAVPKENTFFLYGPGFEIKITRTDPVAWYLRKPEATS